MGWLLDSIREFFGFQRQRCEKPRDPSLQTLFSFVLSLRSANNKIAFQPSARLRDGSGKSDYEPFTRDAAGTNACSFIFIDFYADISIQTCKPFRGFLLKNRGGSGMPNLMRDDSMNPMIHYYLIIGNVYIHFTKKIPFGRPCVN